VPDDRLGPDHRAQAIARLEDEVLDVLVVGGGVTGVGAALDAAGRGLRVGLIEQGDLASGTSSRSSKLIHGGLRYLERLDLALVREALRERGLLLHHLAPHLVTPVPFILPLRHHVWERVYVGAGVALYDRLGGARQLPRAQHLSRRSVQRMAPGLRRGSYVGGIRFWDAQTDDARLVVAAARSAAAHGACIAPRVRALAALVTDGRVHGLQVEDVETQRRFDVRARHVLAATGPWNVRTLLDADRGTDRGLSLRPSKGVHLLLPKSAIRADAGVLARTPTGLLFVIPWLGHWLVGDTDTEWSGDPGQVRVEPHDVDVLLRRLETQLRTRIDESQVLGVFAGVRPLVAADPAAETVELSREHAIATPVPGLTTISGGKLTTYRVMAEQLVDVAVRDLGGTVPPSQSADTPLTGASGFADAWNDRAGLAETYGLDLPQVERLLRRHGTGVMDVLALARTTTELLEVIDHATGVLAAEVVHACTHEGARHVDDVMERRTRIGLLNADRGVAALDRVLPLMAAALGWDADTAERERRQYVASVGARHPIVTADASTGV
jgi:glycerol-3-phosphate dehydrogenase